MATKKKRAPGARKKSKDEPKDERSMAEKIRDHVRKEMGDPTAAETFAGVGLSSVKEVMPTRLGVIDHWVAGIGGLPYGRSVEIAGPEDVGKSSLINHLIWAAQQDGAVASLGDSERKVQPDWVDVFKVDRSQVLLLPARTIEEYLQDLTIIIKKYKRTKMVHFLDSVATTQPQKALDQDLTDAEIPGAMAAAWSRGMRALNPLLSESRSILVLVNQLRSKIGVLYGPTEDTAAGRALKYYLTLRLWMYHGKGLKDGARTVGKWSGVRAVKNHLIGERRSGHILLNYETGWDDDRSTLMAARELQVVDAKCRSVKEARQALNWGYDEAAPDVVVEDSEQKAPPG